MTIRELLDGASKTKLLCVGYKSDGNTLEVKNKMLYTAVGLFNTTKYKRLAIVDRGSGCGICMKVGDVYFNTGHIGTRYYYNDYDVAELVKGLDSLVDKRLNTDDGFIECISAAVGKSYITKDVSYAISTIGGTEELVKKIDDFREETLTKNRKRHEDEESAKRKKAEVEERKIAEEIAAAKQKAVEGFKAKGHINNLVELSFGEYPVIPKLCEDYGVKVPLRTLGWMHQNLYAAKMDDDGSFCVRYYKKTKNAKCSERVFSVLTDLYNAIMEKEGA